MEDNSTNSRLKTWGKIALRPESWPLEFLFAYALYGIGLLVAGRTLMDAFATAWVTMLNVASSKLMLVAILVGAPLLFLRGVRKVSEKEALDRKAVASEATAQRKVAVEIPILITKAYVTGMELSSFQAGIGALEKGIDEYKQQMARWLSDDALDLPAEHTGLHGFIFSAAELDRFYPNLDIALPARPQRQDGGKMVTEPIAGHLMPQVRYLRANNGPFAAAIERYLADLDQYVASLRELANQKADEIRAIGNQIQTKVATYEQQ